MLVIWKLFSLVAERRGEVIYDLALSCWRITAFHSKHGVYWQADSCSGFILKRNTQTLPEEGFFMLENLCASNISCCMMCNIICSGFITSHYLSSEVPPSEYCSRCFWDTPFHLPLWFSWLCAHLVATRLNHIISWYIVSVDPLNSKIRVCNGSGG